MGKGSARRPTDEEKFQANYDKIFGKKKTPPHPECPQPEVCAEPFCSCEPKQEVKSWNQQK